MEFHSVSNKITNLLEVNNFWFEKFEIKNAHALNKNIEHKIGYTLDQAAKALILNIEDNLGERFEMFVLPAGKKIDNKKLRKILSANSIRFASLIEVENITNDIEIGGIPPFGNLFGIDVTIDKKLLDNDKIVFNAGSRDLLIAMKSKDYIMLVKPRVKSFVS